MRQGTGFTLGLALVGTSVPVTAGTLVMGDQVATQCRQPPAFKTSVYRGSGTADLSGFGNGQATLASSRDGPTVTILCGMWLLSSRTMDNDLTIAGDPDFPLRVGSEVRIDQVTRLDGKRLPKVTLVYRVVGVEKSRFDALPGDLHVVRPVGHDTAPALYYSRHFNWFVGPEPDKVAFDGHAPAAPSAPVMLAAAAKDVAAPAATERAVETAQAAPAPAEPPAVVAVTRADQPEKRPVDGTYVLAGGDYVIDVRMEGTDLVVIEPNRRSLYEPFSDGSFRHTSPQTGKVYGMRVLDEGSIEAFQPVEGNVPTRLTRVTERERLAMVAAAEAQRAREAEIARLDREAERAARELASAEQDLESEPEQEVSFAAAFLGGLQKGFADAAAENAERDARQQEMLDGIRARVREAEQARERARRAAEQARQESARQLATLREEAQRRQQAEAPTQAGPTPATAPAAGGAARTTLASAISTAPASRPSGGAAAQTASTRTDPSICMSRPVTGRKHPNCPKTGVVAEVTNGCEAKLDVRVCFRTPKGAWDCGVTWGLAPGATHTPGICEGTGEVWAAALYSEGRQQTLPSPPN